MLLILSSRSVSPSIASWILRRLMHRHKAGFNAAIAVGGLQRLRLEQLSADLPMSPGQDGYPSRRRTARHVAHVHASQLDVSSAFHGGFHAADRGAAVSAA